MDAFELVSDFKPKGDQIRAIEDLSEGLDRGLLHQVLMGVTGSGKTFTVANVIARANRPVLVISHNKTLAAQLFQEFRRFFPRNAVEYFVSYYDYYQPEAYLPSSNTYIAKEVTINDEIDRMRLNATNRLFERRDVIIVASVSCIYGIGAPETYYAMSFPLAAGERGPRKRIIQALVDIQYERQEDDFKRGGFRVRGDVIDVFPAYADFAYRIELDGDAVGRITSIDPLLGRQREEFSKIIIHPRTFFSTPRDILEASVDGIEEELKQRVDDLRTRGRIIEAERLEERTLFDLDMLREFGYCPGIENYSLYLSRRKPGQPPYTLLDYFPRDFLTIIDESHVTIPQIGGMYHGDRSRKETLIEHGFRLPSALDNRPLRFREYEERVGPVLYVSATPAPYEIKASRKRIIEQIIRPTGLIDPEIEIRPVAGQVEDLRREIERRAARKERVLVTTLTKKMAEDLTRHYHDLGLRVRFLHAEIETLERVVLLRDLRKGVFDVLIGINLLREGLDLPEVSLVAVLDADKEGFLRSTTALIQTFGRAARHVEGRAILYADVLTDSIKAAVAETNRRRALQAAYNAANGITPRSIRKEIDEGLASAAERDYFDYTRIAEDRAVFLSPERRKRKIEELEKAMKTAARDLDFEKAAGLRDEIARLKKGELAI
ncbi:MAG: excinuclease ABC subunit UvrB [Acidobacteriota bacterium]|nr:excinuclease ABC subunit UvrB [Acidobacteriota bacterium]MDD8039516.1 excinuclease ABC subunit UvrB [Acidobacteriota bacterium]